MSIFKTSKLWSTVILGLSLLCVLIIVYALIGIRLETVTTREASSYIRRAVQLGIFLMGAGVLIAILGRKNASAVKRSLATIIIMLVPLLIIKTNMPPGTAIFASPRPPGPPPGVTAGGPPPTPRTGPMPLNDISTDTTNPPQFVAVIAQHTKRTNSPDYPGAKAAKTQKELYPDIAPIHSNLSKTDAFKRAESLAESLDWDIVAADEQSGIIEAVVTTFFFRYQDDVVIRVQDSGTKSVIDIRSHSRIGRNDRGKNAERIRKFIKKF